LGFSRTRRKVVFDSRRPVLFGWGAGGFRLSKIRFGRPDRSFLKPRSLSTGLTGCPAPPAIQVRCFIPLQEPVWSIRFVQLPVRCVSLVTESQFSPAVKTTGGLRCRFPPEGCRRALRASRCRASRWCLLALSFWRIASGLNLNGPRICLRPGLHPYPRNNHRLGRPTLLRPPFASLVPSGSVALLQRGGGFP
jgi:hypothetical protein